MEITPSVRKKTVSAFQSNNHAYAHWNIAKECIEHRIHCGYISEAETEEEAVRELVKMVRPMHYDLGERMMDSLKELYGVKTK